MKSPAPWITGLCATLALALAGCSGKTDAKSELEKAATVLEKAEPSPAPAPAQAATAAPAPTQPQNTQPAPAPASELKQALSAYQGGNLEDAVTRLQRLRATPTMTPQQRIALNDAMAAVMTEIYDLASKGDTRAIQAVKQYEQMQTRRR